MLSTQSFKGCIADLLNKNNHYIHVIKVRSSINKFQIRHKILYVAYLNEDFSFYDTNIKSRLNTYQMKQYFNNLISILLFVVQHVQLLLDRV